MGPKCQNGPKKVPILPPSPKFLILPSDAAEKRRHIAVRHRCALFRHTLTIRHIFEMGLSGPLISTDTERSKNDPKKCPIQSQKPKFGLYGAFLGRSQNPNLTEINCSHLSCLILQLLECTGTHFYPSIFDVKQELHLNTNLSYQTFLQVSSIHSQHSENWVGVNILLKKITNNPDSRNFLPQKPAKL